MIDQIKSWLLAKHFKINKKLPAPTKTTINEAKSILILFEGTLDANQKTIQQFSQKISGDRQRRLHSLAYVDAKEITPASDDTYGMKDIKWFGLPFGSVIDRVLQQRFDMLIVGQMQIYAHTEYLVAHIDAAFKIGPNNAKLLPYLDLIIDCSQGEELDTFLQKMLTIIHKVAQS